MNWLKGDALILMSTLQSRTSRQIDCSTVVEDFEGTAVEDPLIAVIHQGIGNRLKSSLTQTSLWLNLLNLNEDVFYELA